MCQSFLFPSPYCHEVIIKVLELLQEEIDEQEQRLNQMEAREEEERAERMQEEEEEMRRGNKVLGKVVEQGVQERLPGSTCSLPPDAGTCTTASLQRCFSGL